MRTSKLFRPRTLTAIFGVYFLVMVIIAWYSGTTLDYHYSASATQFSLMAYLVAAAAILSGVGPATLSAVRYLDAQIDRAERALGSAGAAMEAEPGDAPEETTAGYHSLPPPLAEAPDQPDQADQDIDELLVSLQEIETATEREVEAVEEMSAAPPPRRAAPSHRSFAVLAELKRRRESVPAFMTGPALANIAVIGITAAMLPGADQMLQSNYQLNTALLIGIGYSFIGLALYVFLSMYGIVRSGVART